MIAYLSGTGQVLQPDMEIEAEMNSKTEAEAGEFLLEDP